MEMDKNTLGLLAIAALVVAGIAYAAYSNTDRNTMPEVEFGTTGWNAALDACTEHEFFRPHNAVVGQGVTYTPHRYPNVTGGNITTLIHRGFSQLRQKAPQDSKWITRPPSEEMW